MANSVHWLAPVSMLAALFAGILFALAHHLFYQSLHGTSVPQSYYTLSVTGFMASISKQQLTLAAGTAFAFATKSCLVIAVSTAWVQCFWQAVITRSSGRPLTLESVNTAYSVIHNAFTLSSFAGWRQFSSLFVLALATWLLQISAIVTPATLVVQSQQMLPPPTEIFPLAELRFDVLSHLEMMIQMNPDFDVYLYQGPSRAVKRVAAAVSAQGDILALDPPSTNSSWTSSFKGPVLRCEELSASEQLAVQNNIANWLQTNPHGGCMKTQTYQMWYGRFPYAFYGNDTTMTKSSIYPINRISWSREAAFRLAIMPQMFQVAPQPDPYGMYSAPLACRYSEVLNQDTAAPLSDLAVNSTMIECKLFESTYNTNFNYTEGSQKIDISVPVTDADVPNEFVWSAIGPSNASCAGLNWEYDPSPNATLSSCTFNRTLIEQLSYLAIMDSVTDLLEGDIGKAGFWTNISTQVINTVLMNTDELGFLADDANLGKNSSLQTALRDYGGVEFAGFVNASDSARDKQPLAQAIEQLLQNITISLLGLPQFHSPKLTEVTKITYHNVYIYTKYKLWIAYGLAIACASTAVAIGLYVIFSTRASYSGDFSTFLRVARGAALSNEVDSKDADGRDPLPGYLKKSSIAVSSERQIQSAEDEEAKHLQSVVESRSDWIYSGSDALIPSSQRRTVSREEDGNSQLGVELQDISGSLSADGPHFRER